MLNPESNNEKIKTSPTKFECFLQFKTKHAQPSSEWERLKVLNLSNQTADPSTSKIKTKNKFNQLERMVKEEHYSIKIMVAEEPYSIKRIVTEEPYSIKRKLIKIHLRKQNQ